MAYNPFNIFRRNQKALFAVLTVFIMIMFTLSFGSGDFFERFAKWIGSKGRGEAVCKIDGDTIKDGELAKVRRARIVANTYMSLAAGETASTVRTYTNSQQSKLSEEGKRMAGSVGLAELYLSNPRFMADPSAQQTILQAKQSIDFTLENPNAKSEDKDAARAYQALLNLAERRFGSEDSHFFLNAPNKTSRDTIEFLLWEKKADQLGIRFTRDDVKLLLNREFSGYFRSDVDVRKEMLKRTDAFNMEACWDALAVEFKVRAAQAAVLGAPGKVVNSAPVFGTPYEMFEYYRQQCSPATYEVISIPSSAFIDKVAGQPTDAELNDLYKKYQEDEPNPGKVTPGFKDPRKIAISWLAITGDEPYYQKLAAEQVKVGEVMAKGSGMLTVPLPGVGGAWGAAAIAPLMLKEPAVDAAYSSYTTLFKFQLQNEYASGTMFTRDLLPTSTVRPGTMAALLGGMAGQSAPFGHPAVAASVAMGVPIGYELRDRIKVGLPLLLGAVPGPAQFQTSIGGAASYKLLEPQPLSVETMRPELIKTTVGTRAKALAHGARPNFIDPNTAGEKGDIARFVEEMEKLSEKGKPKDKAAVDKYIAEFKAARGLTKSGEQFGSCLSLRDEWNIEDDLGLEPLVIAQKEGLALARGAHGGSRYVPFGKTFFWTTAFDQMTGQPRAVQTAGTYLAKPYPPEERGAPREDSRPHYVYWVTEDVAPKKTLNLATAKNSEVVRDAWKRTKARELAEAHANKMAEAIRTASADSPDTINRVLFDKLFEFQRDIAVSNDKAFRRTRKFPLADVSPLVPIDTTNLSIEQRVQMMQQGIDPTGRLRLFSLLPPTENIPYPTKEMETALLENRDKPAKTVVVLADAPKDTFYVATLTKRVLKTEKEFKDNVYSVRGPARNILGDFIHENARKSRQSVVELLKKEFKYEETDEQKKKLDENAKSGGRD